MRKREEEEQAKVENLYQKGQNLAAAAFRSSDVEDGGGSEAGGLASLNNQGAEVGVKFSLKELSSAPGGRTEYTICMDNMEGWSDWDGRD